MHIDQGELYKLFHLRRDLATDRMIPIPMCAVDSEGKFHLWLMQGNKLIEAPWGEKGQTEFVEGEYFAQKQVSRQDFYSPFMNFMFQRYIRANINPICMAIKDDIFNLGASLQKIELFDSLRNDRIGIQRFVITETEYIFGVCRSMYDLLQLTAKRIWDGQELPNSFNDMVKINTAEGIQKKYGLPDSWSSFYTQEACLFQKIREYRNDIEHRGLTPTRTAKGTLFITEKGFAVRATYEPFSSFGVWKEETFIHNGLASIRPILAFVIKGTLGAMDRFIDMLNKVFCPPREMAPGYSVFISGPNIKKLNVLEDYMGSEVWQS